MSDCPRAGKWIGGCNFEARYDTVPPSEEFAEQVGWRNDRLEVVQEMHKRVYVRDVCTRCGKTIERSKP